MSNAHDHRPATRTEDANPADHVDRWLRDALPSAPDPNSAGACVDAETLAAWSEGGLDRARTTAVDAHLSSCARCQAMAAAFARAEHADPSVAAAAVIAPSMQPLWKRPPIRWAAVLAAAAAVALVVRIARSGEPPRATTMARVESGTNLPPIATPAPTSAAPSPPAGETGGSVGAGAASPAVTARSLAPSSTPEPATSSSETAHAATSSSRSLTRGRSADQTRRVRPVEGTSERERAPRARAAEGGGAAGASTSGAARGAGAGQQAATDGALEPEAPPALTAPIAPPVAASNPPSGVIAADTPILPAASSERSDVIAASPAASGRVGAGGGGRGAGRGGRGADGFGRGAIRAVDTDAIIVEVVATAGAPVRMMAASGERSDAASVAATRWRVRVQGAIERSIDGGRSWTTVGRAAAGITAGSAPTNDVCWLVGRGGVVLVTGDSVHFAQTSSPSQADLVSVRATSARDATVATATGETFRTDDGGATWH